MNQHGKILAVLSPSGEKVYYRYYAIIGTRVRVVAGYRAFSAFILLRRGKAFGVFFPIFCFYIYVYIYIYPFFFFFWKKIPRCANIASVANVSWKKVLHIRKWTPGEMRSDEIHRTYLWRQNTSEYVQRALCLRVWKIKTKKKRF